MHEVKIDGVAEIGDLRPFHLKEFLASTGIHHRIYFVGALPPWITICSDSMFLFSKKTIRAFTINFGWVNEGSVDRLYIAKPNRFDSPASRPEKARKSCPFLLWLTLLVL
jgi:hypothetical protein